MTEYIRKITDEVSIICRAVVTSDFPTFKNAGFNSVVNNRPDNEAPGQQNSDKLSASAKMSQMEYAFIPAHSLDMETILASVEAYETLSKPVITFCASGTRSAMLWCFAAVQDMGIDNVLETALRAGFQLNHIRPALQNYLEHYA